MKKTIFLTIVLMLCILTGTYAQTAGDALVQEDERESFTQRVEEGVRPKTPGRMTLYGELYARGWFGGHNGNKYIQGADMKGTDTYFGILWEFTNFTGTVFKLKVNPEAGDNGMNAYFDNAYLYTDIAGEAGSKDWVARVSLGRFGFDSAFLSPVDPMGTGDDIQHDGNLDVLNWKFELGTKGDLYPILFMLAGDLDFGYRGTGFSSMNWNNRGATGMFEVRSEGVDLGDAANMSWNVYYMGRYFPNVNGSTPPAEKKGENTLNKQQHSIGGTFGIKLNLSENQNMQFGAGAEYNYWSYGGANNGNNGKEKSLPGRSFQALDWQTGVGYTMTNLFAVGLGIRQDSYSHVQYAVMNDKAPLSDMHVGVSFQYLGLKELAKISLYAGFAYAFGTLYYSDLYKKAWTSGSGKVYSDNDINGYVAGNPISMDVGMGYHPVPNASIYFGYNYGPYGVQAPSGASRDVSGSWGKVYVKGAYTW